VQYPLMVFCRLSEPAIMGDLSEIALPTRFLFLVINPKDDGVNVIWEITEMGRSLGSMLGDQVYPHGCTVTYTINIVIHNSGSKNYFYFQPLNYFISGSLIFADILRDRVQS